MALGLVAFRGRSVAFANNGKGHGGFQFSEKAMAAFQERGKVVVAFIDNGKRPSP